MMGYYDFTDFSPFLERMKKGELTLEEILSNDSIIEDIKTKDQSEFLDFFTNDQMKKLIDYSTRFPKSDDHNTGYKYPFNSTEILCTENIIFYNKLMTEKIIKEKNEKNKKAKDFIKRIHKGGFFEVFFKAIKKAEGNEQELEELEINNDNDNDSIDDENENDEDNNRKESNNNSNNNIAYNYYMNSMDSLRESRMKKNEGKIIYENIDYLLGFLNESDETRQNYVLEGYFHRILSNLIKQDNKGKLIKYLLNYPKKDEFDVLKLFVQNMKRKSKNMFNIIQKLLLFKEEDQDNYYPNSNTSIDNDIIKEKKINLLKLILNELDITNEQEKYECICDSLCGLMSKTQFFENEYNELNPLEYLYKILLNSKNNNKKSNYIFDLLIKINENILKLFDSRCTPNVEEENNEENNDMMNMYNSYNINIYGNLGSIRYTSGINEENRSNLLEKILLNLFNILEKNRFEFLEDFGIIEDNNEFITTYMEKEKKIGIKKVTEVEYIRTILDIFINSCYSEYYSDKVEKLIILLNEKNIFWNLHNLFFLFPNSNIYQTIYSQIIDIVINVNSPKCLIDNFFYDKINNKNLLEVNIDNILSNPKFEFKQTNTKVLSPAFSFVINLLNKINNTDNMYLSETYLKSNDNYMTFIEIFGKDIENIFTQKLLYNNKSTFQGFDFSDKTDEKLIYFGKKNFLELFEEDFDIYNLYKKGGEYKNILEEKRKRIEKEKEEKGKENEKKEKKHENINDLDDDDEDDPLFKVEKINLNNDNDNNNFLSILNKAPEEINNIMDNMEENKQEKKENNEIDIKELENDDENINDIKINEDIEPNNLENKVYNRKYNENLNLNETDKNKDEDKNKDKEIEDNKANIENIKENINEIGEVDNDEIADI